MPNYLPSKRGIIDMSEIDTDFKTYPAKQKFLTKDFWDVVNVITGCLIALFLLIAAAWILP